MRRWVDEVERWDGGMGWKDDVEERGGEMMRMEGVEGITARNGWEE